MTRYTKEISKEMFAKALANNGTIPTNEEVNVFGIDIVKGYGLYGTKVKEESGKYFVDYTIGDSCD